MKFKKIKRYGFLTYVTDENNVQYKLQKSAWIYHVFRFNNNRRVWELLGYATECSAEDAILRVIGEN